MKRQKIVLWMGLSIALLSACTMGEKPKPSDAPAPPDSAETDQTIRSTVDSLFPAASFTPASVALQATPPDAASPTVSLATWLAAPLPTQQGTLLPTAVPTLTSLPTPTLAPTPGLAPPTHIATAAPVARIAGSEQVNVRTGPGTNYPVTTALNPGDTVEPVSILNNWVYIHIGDSDGWVRQDLLNYSGNLRSLPAPYGLGIAVCDPPGSNTADLWAQVHALIGCPISGEQFILGTSQRFANGVMVWRSEPSRMIYAILNDGRWSVYSDTWSEGQYLACSGTYIARGFGKAYCDHPDMARLLGAALAPERAGSYMFIQDFERGVIFGLEGVGTRTLLQNDAVGF